MVGVHNIVESSDMTFTKSWRAWFARKVLNDAHVNDLHQALLIEAREDYENCRRWVVADVMQRIDLQHRIAANTEKMQYLRTWLADNQPVQHANPDLK